MAHRRILSLWFPKLAVEQALRARRDTLPVPFAIIADQNGAKVLKSLNDLADRAGLRAGQPLRDAQAMCPGLAVRSENLAAEAGFLAHLRRWAGRFSPWVAPEGADALVVDLTGCAHLFGGEAALLAQISTDCADLGLTLRAAIADTRGGAWALARYAGQVSPSYRNGDAIAQEARATRSRAVNRPGWERLAAGVASDQAVIAPVIAPVGQLSQVLAPLPLAALRLDAGVVDGLQRLGLRVVRDVLALPRAPFARRFGAPALRRLDQALGLEPEPIAPLRADPHFATRLSFPDPIGLRADIEAGIDRLLPRLCTALRAKSMGARMLRLQAFRADGGASVVEIGLARAANAVDAIRPLLWLKLDQIDVGFGVDCLRLHAFVTEPLTAMQHAGPLTVGSFRGQDHAVADLIGKLGARLGSESVVRLLPSASHIPAKATQIFAAAWCDGDLPAWQAPPNLRPMMIFPPEPVTAPDDPTPPARFIWRRRDFTTRVAIGAERILPEWWFDAPEWRSGPRDYWRVEVEGGERLWLFFAAGRDVAGGWFCEGEGFV